jgi:predicted phosphodiesterase
MPASRKRTVAWDARHRGQVLGPRFDDALETVAEGGIDLVCFTGDLADWGLKSEYTKATRRINAILQKVHVPRSRFYAVPGNHDVQRKVNERSWFGMRKWLEETHDVAWLGRWMAGVGGLPPGTKPSWPDDVLERTAEFWKWFQSFRGAVVASRRRERLGYRETLPQGTFNGIDVPVHIVGLDSAWLCGADKSRGSTVLKDRGSIVITTEQVDAHTRIDEKGLDGLRIGLVHHPLDHLADHEPVRRLLGDGGVDILLHGHQHTPLAMMAAEPGAELRILAAGCLMEGELGKGWPNGFQLIEIDPDTRSGAVHFRKWSQAGHFWPVGSDIYRQAPNGTLTWGAPAKATATAQPPVALAPGLEVVLRMDSLRLVDMNSVNDAIRDHQRDWPTVRIEWPPSLVALVEGLKDGLQGDMTGPGAEDFGADVPLALQKAEQERRRVARLVPALVARARALSDPQLALVLHNLLLVAAYRANATLAFYATWNGLRPWHAPTEWASVQRDDLRRNFASMLGEVVRSGRLPIGRLREADGFDLYDEHGSPGLYVWAPKRVLDRPNSDDICRWLIPQLEYAWGGSRPDALPQSYHLRQWHVDKIVE